MISLKITNNMVLRIFRLCFSGMLTLSLWQLWAAAATTPIKQ